MGKQALDQYSLLHFSIGTLAYFWSIPFWIGLIIHILFEYLENTQTGIYYINKYIIDTGLFNWPGGKHVPDITMNTTFDNIIFAVGWISAWGLDRLGHSRDWY